MISILNLLEAALIMIIRRKTPMLQLGDIRRPSKTY